MNKKTLLIIVTFVIACIISCGVFLYVKPIKNGKVDVAINVETDSDQPQNYQLFFSLDSNLEQVKYTENQKIDFVVDDGKGKSLSAELPSNLSALRFDFDSKANVAKINDITISYSGKVIPINDNCKKKYDCINDVVIDEDSNDNTYELTGEDPFVSWNVSDWGIREYVQLRVNKINIFIKIVILTLLWLMYIIFVIHFDALMQFPIEIVGNRTLIFRLSLNDFKTRFAGSYLGIVWAFVQPVVTILLYWFVFEMAFHATGVGNVPFALWLTCGLVPWFFFSEALMGGTSSLIEYQYLVKKVVFQIDILPVVKIVSSLYVHVFFVLLTIALFLVSGMGISLYWLQTIYYSFCAVVITLGLAYITSSVTAFFRDLTQIINVLLTVGTWLTPIMWNFDTANLPGVVSIVLTANPMFYIVQGYRDSLVNHIWFWQRPALTLYFWMTAVIVFCLGTVIYRRLKVHFADVL